ncbi:MULTISPECIES: hypothetical protein [Halocynthiibacter]|uniref:Uncharacterized protein n=1 Tax=Halocynthiibacter halioticoli TaxID=2986804 RepID=A0AAE3IZ97_9RHOB|nr:MULTISPECIES: hypothetical protein [Halocynthiibacter]MCV6824449.1 hypothetical protein [Halocynthiibacter halioticoli]MCW4057450.1 hypothetical protein [Halocynthiibacter sp. SDUM655004]MDE0589513.1 hypothetical protein [Halocynthiibacter sp. C4]
MTDKPEQKASDGNRIMLGRYGRMNSENQSLTFVLLGQILVFVLAMLHDEFVHYLYITGRIASEQIGPAEVVIGFILFVFWMLLTFACVRILSTPTTSE